MFSHNSVVYWRPSSTREASQVSVAAERDKEDSADTSDRRGGRRRCHIQRRRYRRRADVRRGGQTWRREPLLPPLGAESRTQAGRRRAAGISPENGACEIFVKIIFIFPARGEIEDEQQCVCVCA